MAETGQIVVKFEVEVKLPPELEALIEASKLLHPGPAPQLTGVAEPLTTAVAGAMTPSPAVASARKRHEEPPSPL